MKSTTQIFLFGSLRKGFARSDGYPITLDLEAPIPIREILKRISIAPESVQLAMVNFRAVHKDYAIQPGDRLSLFPKEYPIFADWKDHRF